MTNSKVTSPTVQIESLWLAAGAEHHAATYGKGSSTASQNSMSIDHSAAAASGLLGEKAVADTSFLSAELSPKIQLAPFSDRLALRRKLYVPLGDRSPLRALAPLFAGGQLKQVAMGHWHEAADSAPRQWFMARLVELEAISAPREEPASATAPTIRLVPYLHIGLTDSGDLSLRLLPACQQLGAELALSTLDGVGREFKIPAQTSFIQRLTQLQEMQLELRQEFAIRRSLYQALASAPMLPSQALRYFERLLDESPYPTSRTPASDRLLQRRQLLKAFSSRPSSIRSESTLWDAYGAVAYWVNCIATGSPAQRWHSCCHGAGATLLRQALAYAVALQYDQQEAAKDQNPARPSGAQRSLAASDALQARIQRRPHSAAASAI